MTDITNHSINELIDRLLYSCFDFRIDNNKLIVNSYPNREENPYCVLGFSYWGNKEEYCYELGNIQIQDIIADAFAIYNKYVQEYVKKAVERFYSSLMI